VEPNDEAKDIPLPLRGKTVSRCIVDSALGIDFIEGGERSTIRIESHFLLRRLGPDKSFSTERVADMGKALALIGKTVSKALARGDGALGVVFEDGTVLSVPPDAVAEAWEFAGSDRSGIVSLAGGGLSTWVDVVPPKSRGRP
jgi:hypothetical protein